MPINAITRQFFTANCLLYLPLEGKQGNCTPPSGIFQPFLSLVHAECGERERNFPYSGQKARIKPPCSQNIKRYMVKAVNFLSPISRAIQLLTNCIKRRIFCTRISANSHNHGEHADYYALGAGSMIFIVNSVVSLLV